MQTSGHIDLLRREGARLGDVAAATPFTAPIPGCPGWDVENLLRHMGDVHRWATTVVRERRQGLLRADFPGPDDPMDLLAWYRDGHAHLLAALEATTADDSFWAWGPASSPLAFWARRQAHETAIHRLDVEQAAGLPTGFDDPPEAADGLDEWLTLAAEARRCPVADGRGRSLRLRATDVPGAWLVRLTTEGVVLGDPAIAPDCAVSARAGALFELMMNRRDAAGLEVEGDADVLRAWREAVRF